MPSPRRAHYCQRSGGTRQLAARSIIGHTCRRIASAVPHVGRRSVPPNGMQTDSPLPTRPTADPHAPLPPNLHTNQDGNSSGRQHKPSSQGRMPRSSPPGRTPASRALGRPGRHADANWGPLVGWSVPQTHASCAAARAFPAAQALPTATSAAEDATWPRVSRLARLLRHRRLAPQPPSCERARAVSALGKVGKVLAGWLAGGGVGVGVGGGGFGGTRSGGGPHIHTRARARARAHARIHARVRACPHTQSRRTHSRIHAHTSPAPARGHVR